jgi:branched-subunit amino acid permease
MNHGSRCKLYQYLGLSGIDSCIMQSVPSIGSFYIFPFPMVCLNLTFSLSMKKDNMNTVSIYCTNIGVIIYLFVLSEQHTKDDILDQQKNKIEHACLAKKMMNWLERNYKHMLLACILVKVDVNVANTIDKHKIITF